MTYINNKNLIYGVFALCLMVLSFSLFTNKVNAQVFYSTNTQNSSNYSYYRSICPADFILTVYSTNQYMCYKFLSGGQVLGASTTNYNYNPVSSGSIIPGCLPGYIYSELTGRRCDGNSYNNINLNGGYADIVNFNVRDGNDSNPQEGDNDAEVMEARFDVDNGDIRLDRAEIDFEFTGYNNGENKPWNTFDEVRLLSDGVEIAQMDTDNRSDWDEEDNNTYSLTFANLDEILRENDRANLTVEVDLNSNIAGSNNNYVSWNIFIPDNGLRARDARGSVVYGGDDNENSSINIEQN